MRVGVAGLYEPLSPVLINPCDAGWNAEPRMFDVLETAMGKTAVTRT
jgi:hypothetical protein